MLSHYDGSLIRALQDVYPNIGLEDAKFSHLTSRSPLSSLFPSLSPSLSRSLHPLTLQTEGYWKSRNKHREFFDKFAAKNAFDPLVADNWYNIKTSVVLQEKVCSSSLFPLSSPTSLPLSLLFLHYLKRVRSQWCRTTMVAPCSMHLLRCILRSISNKKNLVVHSSSSPPSSSSFSFSLLYISFSFSFICFITLLIYIYIYIICI